MLTKKKKKPIPILSVNITKSKKKQREAKSHLPFFYTPKTTNAYEKKNYFGYKIFFII